MTTHHSTQLRDHDLARMTNVASQIICQPLRSLAVVEMVYRDIDGSAPVRDRKSTRLNSSH